MSAKRNSRRKAGRSPTSQAGGRARRSRVPGSPGRARWSVGGAGALWRAAVSLPPLFRSSRPALFADARAPAIIRPLIDGLSPHVDLWLAETQSSRAEARFARTALTGDKRPFWVS